MSCKAPLIQSHLASLKAMQTFLNTLAALIVALPLGYVSDQVDRRKILAMILAGMLAALLWTILVATQTGLSLRLIWLTSVFTLFGGGNYAAEMIMGVMIVDTCSARDRTKTLYYMYSCFIFVEIVAPPIAYGTAKLSLWIPFAIGIMCLVLDCGVLIIMPDVSKKDPSRGETPMRIDPDPPAANSNTENDEETKQSYVQQLYEVVRLFKQRNMLLSLPIFLIGSFRAISLRAVLQYASSRFEWDFSDTNALVTEVASINLALFCFILPSLITLINNHYHPHLQLLNLSIVQGSLVVLGSGALLLSLAPSSTSMIIALGFYAMGFGVRATMLSLVTSWFAESVRARIYGCILAVELTGMLVGETMLQSLLAVSVHLPTIWKGLPFAVAAAWYMVALLCASLIRVEV